MLNRSETRADPLSAVLELLEAKCELSGELVAGGPWSRRFSNLSNIKFCAATKGTCWHFMDGMDAPVLFEAGDILVTNGALALTLASDSSLIAAATAIPLEREHEGQYRIGQDCEFTMLGGVVKLDTDQGSLLRIGLPPLIHVRGTTPEAKPLAWLLEQIVTEMKTASLPGRTVLLSGLTQLLFVQTLRAYLSHAPAGDKGWLKAFGDRRLTAALHAIHSAPAHNWKLEELAKEAGMSRTSFAIRFREMIGVPPLTYLTEWRIQLAKRELRAGASNTEAALAVGYSSESAFSNAFKRSTNIAPGMYRRIAEHGTTKLPSKI